MAPETALPGFDPRQAVRGPAARWVESLTAGPDEALVLRALEGSLQTAELHALELHPSLIAEDPTRGFQDVFDRLSRTVNRSVAHLRSVLSLSLNCEVTPLLRRFLTEQPPDTELVTGLYQSCEYRWLLVQREVAVGFSREAACANVERNRWHVYGRHFGPQRNTQSGLWEDQLEPVSAVREQLLTDPNASGPTVEEEQTRIFERMNDGELTHEEAVSKLRDLQRRGF